MVELHVELRVENRDAIDIRSNFVDLSQLAPPVRVEEEVSRPGEVLHD
jgi:hypothetical protein